MQPFDAGFLVGFGIGLILLAGHIASEGGQPWIGLLGVSFIAMVALAAKRKS